MMNGWIKKVVMEKGFGFIRDDQNQEYFFHRSALDHGQFEDLIVGQMVEFEVEESSKGPRAGTVRTVAGRR